MAPFAISSISRFGNTDKPKFKPVHGSASLSPLVTSPKNHIHKADGSCCGHHHGQTHNIPKPAPKITENHVHQADGSCCGHNHTHNHQHNHSSKKPSTPLPKNPIQRFWASIQQFLTQLWTSLVHDLKHLGRNLGHTHAH